MVLRSGPWRFALATAAVSACVHATPPRLASEPRTPEPVARPAFSLSLPGGSERCTAVLPLRLDRDARALAPLVSHSEELPWELAFEVEAYARAERSRPDGRRAVVEIFRFTGGERGPIERELARVLAEPIAWEERVPDPRLVCEGEVTCSPLRGRFLDVRTVRLQRGAWGDEGRGEPEACAALLERHPRAFEVSSRSGAQGAEFARAEAVLRAERDGFVRESARRYADPGSAERALQNALQGHDELPVFAGVTAASFGLRRGASVEQRSEVSRDELTLLREGRERLARAEQHERAPSPSELDPRDVERVKAAFDVLRPRLRPAPDGASSPEARGMDRLLLAARAHAPDDEGLIRRHYELALEGLGAPRAALALAERALAAQRGDVRAWELRLRAALARCDEPRLADELARAHALPRSVALRMARELAQRGAERGDHERAEWAFLSARKLASDASRRPRAPLSVRLPLAELGRMFGYLARATGAGDLGLQLLAFGKLEERSPGPSEGPWSAATSGGGRPGLVLGATTWDDAQLTALGRALLAGTQEGPLEVTLALEELEGVRRTTFSLSGQRVGSELVVEAASRSLARLSWPRLGRLLLTPLAKLTGSTYPPDVLVVRASEGDEQARIARAAEEEARVRCGSEAELVSCRGALADPGAAARALRQVARALLVEESRALWTSHD